MTSSLVLVGIRGAVIALDRATGQQLWKTDLRGMSFVTVMLDNDRVFAATKGEVSCLDAATGQLLWCNELPGQGRGLAMIATASGSSNALPLFREKQRQDEAASAAATTAVIASS